MRQIGVWERQEGLAEWISRLAAGAAGGRTMVRACTDPAGLAGIPLDLLVISPTAEGPGAETLRCRTVLVPGDRSPAFHTLPADLVVTYGIDHRNTITLSSLEEARAAIAIQREFPTLDGTLIEEQEIIFPCLGQSPALLLAEAGTALLLDLLPQAFRS